MTDESQVVAATEVDLVFRDGRRVSGRIWLGSPYTVDELQAKCPCGIDGLDEPLRAISGNDTLQALLLAARLLALRLVDFQDKGGRVLYPGTEERFELESCFGAWVAPLVRE